MKTVYGLVHGVVQRGGRIVKQIMKIKIHGNQQVILFY